MALLAGVNGASSTRCMAANMPPQPAVVTARRAVFVGRMAVVQDTITGRRTVSLSHMKLRAALAEPELDEASPSSTSAAYMTHESDMTSTFASLLDDEDGEYYEDEVEDVDESLLVDNLGLCAETAAALKKRGIQSLFPIQRMVFQPAAEGRDLIGRAKTGSGKTLAFALPVIENLLAEDKISAGGKRHLSRFGRPPRCLILAPTRELANQVAKEFETACPNLVVKSVYGGVSIGVQISALERGVDVVVGTPGRVIDLIERRKLNLSAVRFAILDEADQMLDMGFQDDMEEILSKSPPERQTLLFSATLPTWVHKVAKKYLRDPLVVDLVGEENTGKLADTIRLMVMQVSYRDKPRSLVDILSVHAAGGKSIVFTRTKAGADEVAAAVNQSQLCEALHGDIPQAQREKTLKRFRDGDFNVLVATDVAARGLDIPSVELVVHYDIPQDSESFLHRSGRTGRAGNKGAAIVMHTDAEAKSVGFLLKQVKVTEGEVVGAPDPAEVMTAASRTVLTKLDRIDNTVISFFEPAAEKLLASGHPTKVLAAALAAMSGFRNVPEPCSLLTGEKHFVTFRLMSAPGRIDGFNSLAKVLQKMLLRYNKQIDGSKIGKVRLVSDREKALEGAAFDVPSSLAADIEQCVEVASTMGCTLERPTKLPLDLNELTMGRRSGRAPSADRVRDRWGGSSRDGGFRGGGYSSSRDAGGRSSRESGGYGGNGRSGYGDRRGGGGGGNDYSFSRGGDSRRGGSSRGGNDDWSGGGGGGGGGYGGRSGGYDAKPRGGRSNQSNQSWDSFGTW
eukprot:jgi/Chrzof1/4760/Cz14g25080.t1